MVSVVIPNYNHASFLEKRIKSVLEQSYDNFEVILLDDLSTDNSREIMSKYKEHPKVSELVFNEENSGSTFAQWKKGINLAKGKYIWFAESDDWASPYFLEYTVKYLEKDKNTSLCYTDSIIVNRNGDTVTKSSVQKNVKFSTTRWDDDYINKGEHEILDFLSTHTTINNMSAVLMRTDIVKEHINKITKHKVFGDVLLCSLIIMNYDIQYVAKPLNYYRTDEKNTSQKHIQSGTIFQEQISVQSQIIALFNHKKTLKKKVFKKTIAILFERYTLYNYSYISLLRSLSTQPKIGIALNILFFKESVKKIFI